MKRNHLAALLFGGASVAIAAECTDLLQVVTPIIQVSFTGSTADRWDEIVAALDQQYGDSLNDFNVMQVRVPVKVCFAGYCGVSMETSFQKPCNQSMREAAESVASNLVTYAEPDFGGSGGNTGSGSGPIGEGDPFAYCTVGLNEGCSEVAGVMMCETIPVLNCPGVG